ncbi:MAG: type II secretion system ATPase GspE [Candidatus Firestonebacteria bacterium]|nr:type II secretion system ATPase GspE [Candidatus Firestonebacteria bacterium]
MENINDMEIDKTLLTGFPLKIATRLKALPLKEKDGNIIVAVSDKNNLQVLDEIVLILGKKIEPLEATEEEIITFIKRYYGVGADTVAKMVAESSSASMEKNGEFKEIDEIDDTALAQDASVIQFVNQIFVEALKERATDIHLEPRQKGLKIRFRVDGNLRDLPLPEALKYFRGAIVSRIKIMAELNIAERRLPQDGRIEIKASGKQIDCRVSTIPTLYGEGVVLRILDKTSVRFGLKELGMLPDTLQKFEKLIEKPYGIILVTGPTGSGKTTTLYSALSKINTPEKKIITVEEPVEYNMEGINQIPVNSKIGLTFARGLRHILRHDPDVIMVGEIRDLETAEIAIRASLTGHLVFATLHTNDAAGAATRLIDMGIEPFLVASSVVGILAQRLVREIDKNCRNEYLPDLEYLKDINFKIEKDEKFYKGKGCDRCLNTGYYGRSGIYELLVMNETMKKIIMNRAMPGEIKAAAVENGMRTLREDGWEKVKRGITTISEVIKVTQEDDAI